MVNEVIDISKLEKHIKFTFLADDILPDFERLLDGKKSKVKLPGFRPGKIPRDYLYRHYGNEILREVVQRLVSGLFLEQKESHQWRVAGNIVYDIEGDLPQTFTEIPVEIKGVLKVFMEPEIASFKEITPSLPVLTKYKVLFSKEEIDESIQKLAASRTKSRPLDAKRPAQEGDTLAYQMEYTSSEGHGNAMEGAFQLGSGMFPEEFENTLVGISEGHQVSDNIRIPKDFPDKSLAGKKVKFKVVFSEILETVPHEVDEAFLKSTGHDSWETLREEQLEELKKQSDHEVHQLYRRQLDKFLSQHLSFPVPNNLVEAAFQSDWKNVQKWKNTEYWNEKDFFATVYQASEDEARQKVYQNAEQNVRVALFLEKVFLDHALSVDGEAVKKQLEEISKILDISYDHAVQLFKKDDKFRKMILDSVSQQTALEWVMQQCPSTEEKEIAYAQLQDERKKADAFPQTSPTWQSLLSDGTEETVHTEALEPVTSLNDQEEK